MPDAADTVSAVSDAWKSAPFAAAVVILVIGFLVFLFKLMTSNAKREDARDRMYLQAQHKRDELFTNTVTRINDQADLRAKECHSFHGKSIETMSASADAIRRHSDEIKDLKHTVNALIGTQKRKESES